MRLCDRTDEANTPGVYAVADKTYEVLPTCPHEIVDDLIQNMAGDHSDRKAMDEAKTRYAFAGIAMQIADDRYSAGSTAATLAVILMLKFGTEAALNFARDLEHHQH